MSWPLADSVRRHTLGAASVLVALVVVGPLLAPGFTLAYDMVFVPRPHWSTALLGIAPALPRSVPTELLVTAASTALPAALVQKAILLFIFGGSAAGAARLIDRGPAAARVAAGVLYAWNPFTYERLLLGHWSLLLGYAVLPWAVAAARSFRRRAPASAPRLVLSLTALTSASPYLGIVGGATALAVAFWPPVRPPRDDPRPTRTRRQALFVVAGGLGVNLPWLIPIVLGRQAPIPAGPSVALFGARADAPLGTIGSLFSLGGLWRTDLAPPGRAVLVWLPAFALILGLTVFGWRRWAGTWSQGARRGLLAAAIVGLILAIAPRVPGAHSALVWIVGAIPGGGLLRDSQKFVIPLALSEAVGFGFGVGSVLEMLPPAGRLVRGMALALTLLPVALAPTLVWGVGGRLHAASYPESWAVVQHLTATDPLGGGILVLPWHAYLPFRWNHDQTVHEPAPLYFSRPVLAASRLEFGTTALPGEDPWSRLADPILLRPRDLAPRLPGLGIRYVLLFKEGQWSPLVARLAGLQRVADTPDLTLYRGTYAGRVPRFPTPPLVPVLLGDAIALAVVAAAASAALRWRLGHAG